MMKKVLGIAMVALSLASASAFAQSNDNKVNDTKKARIEKSCAGMKKECKDKEVCGKVVTLDEFEGINLTEAQKTQLTALKQQQRDKIKAARELKKADKTAKKEDKKEMTKEQRIAKRQQMDAERKAQRKDYLAKVKDIIGADNYVTFLENQYVQAPSKAGHGSLMHKGDKKSPRGDKQMAHKSQRKSDRKQMKGTRK